MKYGGNSQYGGVSQYGGGDSYGLIYYRILKSMGLPGLWPQDDDKFINLFLRTDCKGLEHGQASINSLEKNIFPHLTHEMLPEWEALLGTNPSIDDTIETRKDNILSHWRGAASTTLSSLRATLADVLNMSVYYYTDFAELALPVPMDDSNDLGLSDATAANLLIVGDGATSLEWNSTVLSPSYITMPLPTAEDEFMVQLSVSGSSDTLMLQGLFLSDAKTLSTSSNAVMVEADDAANQAYLNTYLDGTFTENATGDFSPITFPDGIALIYNYTTRSMSAYLSTDKTLADVKTNGTLITTATNLSFTPKYVGIYARTAAASPTISGTSTYTQLVMSYAQSKNNVYIQELKADAQEFVYFAFISRYYWDTNNGIGDLAGAQKICDIIKQAHTLILVGESHTFRYDDEHSLYDRDVYGY